MAMEINQDLQDARSLLEHSGTDDEKRKYRKAAEIILLKALHRDPENKEAQVLLQSARASSTTTVATPPPLPEPTAAEIQPRVEPELFKDLQPKKKTKSALKFPIGLTLVVLVGGSLFWKLESHSHSQVTFAAPVERIERVRQSDFQPAAQPVVQETHDSDFSPAAASAPADEPVAAPVDKKPAPVDPNPKPALAAVVKPKPVTPPVIAETPRSVPKPEVGTLAVSSPTAADIYQNGQLIGSTPTTLQLPAGQQTLEYRHGEFRTVVTHEIKPGETTAASVTFDISVQINARPWAQVFLDGATRRPLGQTPLSGVSVPIGGTLVFENPNFRPKTYRITEKDATIQLNFP